MATERKKYKVVKEFTLPVLQEVGSVVELTNEEAVSGLYGPCIEPIEDESKKDEGTGKKEASGKEKK